MIALFFLALLPLSINCAGTFRQNYTSSHRVGIKLIVNVPERRETLLKFVLGANDTRTLVFPMPEYEDVFDYSVTMTHFINGNILGQLHHSTSPNQIGKWLTQTLGSHGISLTVKTTYACQVDYYGDKCEDHCDGKAAKLTRQRCDSEGLLRCDYGRMGEQCAQAVDPRKCSCQNSGICVSTADSNSALECECPTGFSGDKCEIVHNNSTIVESTSCSRTDTCLNGGICLVNGPRKFCACAEGYAGEFCEIKTTTTTLVSTYQFNTFVTLCSVITICSVFFIAICLTYRHRSTRSDALRRGQDFAFPQLAKTDCVMVDSSKKQQVFSIENDYSCEPIYSTIKQHPLPPLIPPPKTPNWQ